MKSAKLKLYSGWIDSVVYVSTGRDTGFLVIFPKCSSTDASKEYAMLYGNVPPQWSGLTQAGIGGKSVGRAYNRLVRGKFPYQRVTGKDLDDLKAIVNRTR